MVERGTPLGPMTESADETGADRDRDRLGAIVRAELLEDTLEVGLHRVRRDAELARDLPRGRAIGHLLQDLPFALRQGRRAGLIGRGLRLLDAPGRLT